MSGTSTAYLSGEPIVVTGAYEVVAADDDEKLSLTEPTIRELNAGDVFPDFDGRAVQWHLLSEPSGPSRPSPRSKPRKRLSS